MTTALCNLWKLKNANICSLKLLKHSKWKPKEASEILLNSLTLLKGKVLLKLQSYTNQDSIALAKDKHWQKVYNRESTKRLSYILSNDLQEK